MRVEGQDRTDRTVLARGLFKLRGREGAMEVYQLLSDGSPTPEEARVAVRPVPTPL